MLLDKIYICQYIRLNILSDRKAIILEQFEIISIGYDTIYMASGYIWQYRNNTRYAFMSRLVLA